jgi:hypothetical protein
VAPSPAGQDPGWANRPLSRHGDSDAPIAAKVHSFLVFTELATEAADWAGYDGFAPDACLINRYQPCGEAHEIKGYDALMRLHEADPSKLLSDKGYDSDDIRRDLIDRGIEPVIPP